VGLKIFAQTPKPQFAQLGKGFAQLLAKRILGS